jgi:pyoverdine/dityrosine biosynthesis protein Dit1
MTHIQINELYEESVYQIRLRVAINLLAVTGVSHAQALEEADKFIALLQSEDFTDLKNKFK